MKTTLSVLFMIFGFTQSATASAGAFLACKEITQDQNAPKRTMVLRQVGDDAIVEDAVYPFELSLFAAGSEHAMFAGSVSATLKDVVLNFTAADGSVRGIVFKDELDQTAVHFDGEDIGFDCGN